MIVGFLGLMAFFTFLQVVLRALFIHANQLWANTLMGHVDWADPLVRLLILWVTFLGASLLTGENRHIKIDILSEVLPTRWLPVRDLILSAACVLVSSLMVGASVGYIRLEMAFGGSLFLGLPAWAGQIILPIGFSLILFRFLIRGIQQLMEISGRRRT